MAVNYVPSQVSEGARGVEKKRLLLPPSPSSSSIRVYERKSRGMD